MTTRSPRFKIYSPEGSLLATADDLTIAGAILCVTGPGSRVKDGETRRIIWVEPEDHPSADSFDAIAAGQP